MRFSSKETWPGEEWIEGAADGSAAAGPGALDATWAPLGAGLDDHLVADLIEGDPKRREDIGASEHDLIRWHAVVQEGSVQRELTDIRQQLEGALRSKLPERPRRTGRALRMLTVEGNSERPR